MPGANLLLSGEMERSLPTMVLHAGPVAKAVLVILLVFSVISWAIILQKMFRLHILSRESGVFWRHYRSGNLHDSLDRCLTRSRSDTPLRSLLLAGLKEAYDVDGTVEDYLERVKTVGRLPREKVARIERAMERRSMVEMTCLERFLPFLATVANVSPFFGLFGTVWGVMRAFLAMGVKGSASLAVVGPGIAEALITTVAGLAAAIPAVIAYNHFIGRLRAVSSDMERLHSSLADRLTRGSTDGIV